MGYNINDRLVIKGGNPLFGSIDLQTSKNAVLPIMSASIITEEKVTIKNVPNLTDVANMQKILEGLGVEIDKVENNYIINPQNVSLYNIDSELYSSMRSSIFLLGSMLARLKQTYIYLPGGCKIGARPIDLHIKAFQSMGVDVLCMGEKLFFDAKNAHPTKIKLKLPSVGVTENIVQFACTLKGKTTILNPAREPEVVDLCNFLNSCGARIFGAGSKKITIIGVDKLHGTQYQPITDRIVAGSIMVAVAACGGDVIINNVSPTNISSLIKILRRMGCQIKLKCDNIQISNHKRLKNPHRISTGFYPKFPTDLQSLMLVLSTVSDNSTKIHEKVFENRFLIVDELTKMGASIERINNHQVKVQGEAKLTGCMLESKDLRGGMALIVAALAAQGKSIVSNVHFVDRGYVEVEKLLGSLGADVRRV